MGTVGMVRPLPSCPNASSLGSAFGSTGSTIGTARLGGGGGKTWGDQDRIGSGVVARFFPQLHITR